MQPKTQRKRTPKTPRTPAQDVLDKAVEALVKEGIFTGESGYHELIHEVSKSFLQGKLSMMRGELLRRPATIARTSLRAGVCNESRRLGIGLPRFPQLGS